MLYTDRWYQKLEIYAINKVRAKYSAELLKHCVNERQKDRRPEKLQWKAASGFALLAYVFTIRSMGMDSP